VEPTTTAELTDRQRGIYARIRPLLSDRLGEPEVKITLHAEFVGDLNADSLDLVEIVLTLDKEFDLNTPDEVAEQIRTVWGGIKYLDDVLPADAIEPMTEDQLSDA